MTVVRSPLTPAEAAARATRSALWCASSSPDRKPIAVGSSETWMSRPSPPSSPAAEIASTTLRSMSSGSPTYSPRKNNDAVMPWPVAQPTRGGDRRLGGLTADEPYCCLTRARHPLNPGAQPVTAREADHRSLPDSHERRSSQDPVPHADRARRVGSTASNAHRPSWRTTVPTYVIVNRAPAGVHPVAEPNDDVERLVRPPRRSPRGRGNPVFARIDARPQWGRYRPCLLYTSPS